MSGSRTIRAERVIGWEVPTAARYALAVFTVLLADALFHLTRQAIGAAHVSLLYLAVVALVAYAAGSGPAVLSAFLSFISWNYFFLSPVGTLQVHDPRDLIALFMFLAAAVLIGELAGRAREQAVAARERERETAMLYDISMASAGNTNAAGVLARVLERVIHAVRADGGAVLLPDAEGVLQVVTAIPAGDPAQLDAHWRVRAAEVLQTGGPLGWDPPEDRGPIYLPLQGGDRIAGVLLVLPGTPRAGLSWQSRRVILAAASHMVIALERERLSREAAQVEALCAAEQFRSTLLSSVSHDLRTPLASIKAAATSLLQSARELSPAARQDLLSAINEETDRLNTFVGDLLDISRLEAGAWRPEKEWFELTDIIGTVLGRLDETASARVRLHLPADLPMVPVDCVQFGQALWNLLENALKFSPAAQPVDIEAGTIHPDTLRVTISDRGLGVPAGEEERIFEKFYRAAGDRRRRSVPGTGLGLAIARGIIEAHGGQIRYLPRPGGGATFEILLPLRPPDMQEPPVIAEYPVEGEENDGW